ncbi:hypothetical protein C7999DRAFT_18418 [Corynascus novoguineensis]|uniref:Uncharacterized protein n=1 Tax=Corynascus novoguineensis TaxID=1126955 RepID=A0AAN7CJE3_9PEZI|nr:hypothetical protein C7999DRAFT_18418 [Corynascus novoguineensis]
MEIDQGPDLDCSHNAYHEFPTGSNFRPEHFQSEWNNSHRRYKTQRGESPFTAGARATPGFKPRNLLHRPENLARVTSLIYRLLGHNPIESFAINCEKTLANWISLLRETTPPHNVSSSDPRWAGAFKVLDSIITGRQGEYLLRRLAYVQLTRLFASLEAVIKSDRDNGRIHREPYYTNAHIAMDIYMSAQERDSNTGELRRKLRQGRRRFSRRWSDLAILAPLFVLIYSDAAEVIINDFKKTDGAALKLVATRILETCPDQLMVICTHLTEAAETAASNPSCDIRQFVAAQIRQFFAPLN